MGPILPIGRGSKTQIRAPVRGVYPSEGPADGQDSPLSAKLGGALLVFQAQSPHLGQHVARDDLFLGRGPGGNRRRGSSTGPGERGDRIPNLSPSGGGRRRSLRGGSQG